MIFWKDTLFPVCSVLVESNLVLYNKSEVAGMAGLRGRKTCIHIVADEVLLL